MFDYIISTTFAQDISIFLLLLLLTHTRTHARPPTTQPVNATSRYRLRVGQAGPQLPTTNARAFVLERTYIHTSRVREKNQNEVENAFFL